MPLLPVWDECSFAVESQVLQLASGEGTLEGRGHLPAHRQGIWCDSMDRCHWTQVVATAADDFRCCNFISVLFPELYILAHFKRSKQLTVSMLISKPCWWERQKRYWRKKMTRIFHRIRDCGSQPISDPAVSLLALWGDISSLWSRIVFWHLCVLKVSPCFNPWCAETDADGLVQIIPAAEQSRAEHSLKTLRQVGTSWAQG